MHSLWRTGHAPLPNIFLKLPLSVTPIRIIPVIKRLNSIYCKIFIYIHKNLFAPQAQDLLEKMAEILLYNFHREHILLKLKAKKLLRKIKSKNLTAGVYALRRCRTDVITRNCIQPALGCATPVKHVTHKYTDYTCIFLESLKGPTV